MAEKHPILAAIAVYNDEGLLKKITENPLTFRQELSSVEGIFTRLQSQNVAQEKRLEHYSTNLEVLYNTKGDLKRA